MASTYNTSTPTVEAAILNAVAHDCWQTSEDHGFHEDWYMADWLEELADKSEDGRRDLEDDEIEHLRVIANTLRTNIIGTKLMLIVSELSEALESLRDVGSDGVMNGEGNVPEELADANIRVGDLAGIIRAVNIGDVQVAKMAVNAKRPHKHGRKL